MSQEETTAVLTSEQIDNTVVLYINSPPVNALNEQMLQDLEDNFDRLAVRDDVRAVIITARGDRAFVAGVDVNLLSRKELSYFEWFFSRVNKVLKKIDEFPKPLICALNSHAVGNGCELAMVCDIRVACPEVSFTFPECKFGVVSAGGATQRLPRLISKSQALYYMYTAEPMKAERAYALNLVDFIRPAGDVLNFSLSLAQKISANAPTTTRAVKQLVKQTSDKPLAQGLAEELSLCIDSTQTLDFYEGVTAYLDKREPLFKGA